MEDVVESITRGNPGSVKAVLASVVLALASYQLILAAIGYRKLPVIEAEPAFSTHRASGDVIAILLVLVALACLGAYGFEDDYVLHAAAGAGAVAVLALKVTVVRTGVGSRFLPLTRRHALRAARADLVHRHTRLPRGGGLTMQLFGSIAIAFAIVAVTIALVTAKLGPNAEEDSSGRGGDRTEQEDNSGRGGGEDR